jgi:hypothetical protein
MSSDEPASKKHKTGTEDVDSFSVWRNTIPDDISENTTRDIGAEITAHEQMKTAIWQAWRNASSGHPEDKTKAATTPLKRAVFMCKTGAVVSAEFPQNDTTLNETFSVLQLPESLAYPHPVRACNVCYDAAKVVEMVTSYVAGTADASGTTPDDDALEVGMAKVYDLLERVAIYNSWDARIHLECALHVANVKARLEKEEAAAATATPKPAAVKTAGGCTLQWLSPPTTRKICFVENFSVHTQQFDKQRDHFVC